jgi:hypothetical protein
MKDIKGAFFAGANRAWQLNARGDRGCEYVRDRHGNDRTQCLFEANPAASQPGRHPF